jgi:hypothetical protein
MADPPIEFLTCDLSVALRLTTFCEGYRVLVAPTWHTYLDASGCTNRSNGHSIGQTVERIIKLFRGELRVHDTSSQMSEHSC